MTMKSILVLAFLFPASVSYALKFNSYINEHGETVFSNLPEECVQNAALTCLQYHPVMSPEFQTGAATGPERKSANRQTSKSNLRAAGKSSAADSPQSTQSSMQMEILDRVVESNRLMNQLYPAQPDPAQAREVRQQQEKILDVLDIINNAASGEEKNTIERAMDVLRSNMIR